MTRSFAAVIFCSLLTACGGGGTSRHNSSDETNLSAGITTHTSRLNWEAGADSAPIIATNDALQPPFPAVVDTTSTDLPEPGALLTIAIVGGALLLARSRRRRQRPDRDA